MCLFMDEIMRVPLLFGCAVGIEVTTGVGTQDWDFDKYVVSFLWLSSPYKLVLEWKGV